MSRIYHGRIDLKWCGKCNSPVIRGHKCPRCRNDLIKVEVTPPGDIQPAFPHDLQLIEDVVDSQWGEGTYKLLHGSGGPVLLNPCPSPDRLLEVIMEGGVVGSLKYDVQGKKNNFILREAGGSLLRKNGHDPTRGWVKIDRSVIPFLEDGKNLLSPGIIDASPSIHVSDEVLVLDDEGTIVGSGISRKEAGEMVGTRGMGVKIRWCQPGRKGKGTGNGKDDRGFKEIWDEVVDINRPLLWKDISRAREFIRSTVNERGLPAAVSFSGGKDSLATLLLVMGSDTVAPVLFVDTGLEFPETIDHVHEVVEELGQKLIEGSPMSGFFDEIDKFGPPGRDHRWCCKVCKLGPMSDLIKENFPGGVLTFIGQRRYESESRKSKGPVWKNPWVPGQVGASPIQDWNALQVWLYIFMMKVSYNPLYNRGYQRIGCWLCPSCDMAENDLVEGTRIDSGPWKEYLDSYREKNALAEEWIEHGFHRFKTLPPHMRSLAEDLGLDLKDLMPRRRSDTDPLITLVRGSNTCVDGISREGAIGSSVPWDRFKALLNILGPVEEDHETGGVSIRPEGWRMKRDMVEIFPDGTLIVRGPDPKGLDTAVGDLTSIVKRTAGCVGCSICVARCDRCAISIVGGVVVLDPESCVHCGRCLGPCPAESFEEDPFTDR